MNLEFQSPFGRDRWISDWVHIGELFAEIGFVDDRGEPSLPYLPNIGTGFTGLDQLLGGLGSLGSLAVIAGWTSVGKSSFALSIAKNVALQSVRVFIVSLQTSRKRVLTRLLASEAGVDQRRMEMGLLAAAEETLVQEATNAFHDTPLCVAHTMPDNWVVLWRQLKEWKQKTGFQLLVIDDIRLFSNDATYQMSAGAFLRVVAKLLGVTILVTSQLDAHVRATSYYQRPSLLDLPPEGKLDELADSILLLTPKGDSSNTSYPGNNVVEVIVAKHRFGCVGSVLFHFNKPLMRFTEVKPFPEFN